MLRKICDINKIISKTRFIGELVNQIGVKRWKILGGAPLHWRFFGDQKKLVRIAAALYNCFTWNPKTFPFKRQHDEADFKEMVDKFGKPSVIFPLVFDNNFSAKKFDLCE